MERPMPRQMMVVAVTIEDRNDGGLRVNSPTLPGLMLSGLNKQAICAAIAPAIQAILERKGYKVTAVHPNRPIREVMREPSPRNLDMHVQQEQFVVEYLDAA
jgi:hypothetical protein